MDMNRQKAENKDIVLEWYNMLQKVITDEGIVPDDIWNMDETGFRIGIGKSAAIVITRRTKSHYFGIPQNRESATAIEAISAAGEAIPAFLILSAVSHSARWYDPINNLKPNTRVAVADTGYSNDQISYGWLQHYEEHSRCLQVGAKRLLLLNGHGSHHTREFIKFCDDHGIIPFGLPPNLTHLLQPLDVVVFQPYKHYHGMAVERLVRDGIAHIAKINFVAEIEGIRAEALKRSTIISAFKKTGISPFNPSIVLEQIEARNASQTPSPPRHTSSSPIGTPHTYRHLQKSAHKVDDLIGDLLSPSGITTDEANLVRGFIKGSLTTAAELLQAKRDLGRTKYAQEIEARRRASKNYRLQKRRHFGGL